LDRTLASLDVVATGIEEPFIGGFSGPNMKGHGPAVEVITKAAGNVHLGLLDNVGRVDAGGQSRVHVDLDQLSHRWPVTGEQFADSRWTTVRGLVE
jgi:hypothetical protein